MRGIWEYCNVDHVRAPLPVTRRVHPFTDEPLVDVFAVNHFVAQEVSGLFAKRFGADAAATLEPL